MGRGQHTVHGAAVVSDVHPLRRERRGRGADGAPGRRALTAIARTLRAGRQQPDSPACLDARDALSGLLMRAGRAEQDADGVWVAALLSACELATDDDRDNTYGRIADHAVSEAVTGVYDDVARRLADPALPVPALPRERIAASLRQHLIDQIAEHLAFGAGWQRLVDAVPAGGNVDPDALDVHDIGNALDTVISCPPDQLAGTVRQALTAALAAQRT